MYFDEQGQALYQSFRVHKQQDRLTKADTQDSKPLRQIPSSDIKVDLKTVGPIPNRVLWGASARGVPYKMH